MEHSISAERELVLEVAALLQAADQGQVLIEDAIDGLEFDIVVQKGRGRGKRITIIECKAYSRLVGTPTLRAFASVFQYLRETGQANSGWLVTSSGFTPGAQQEADNAGVELFTVADLRRRLQLADTVTTESIARFQQASQQPAHGSKRVFVIMPFNAEMLDVFILGIRWAAATLGVVAHRADDLHHAGDIVTEVKRAIREYEIVIGDTTGANPNVCYEIGIAHALDRPTILICRDGQDLPFDLQGINHLKYPNVVELRAKLKSRLESLLRAT